MKILQLCNKIPFPPNDGGSIAMLNITRSIISSGHSVTILAMNTTKHQFQEGTIPSELKELIDFRYVSVDTSLQVGHMISNLFFSKLPYNAQRFLSEKYSQKLIQLLDESKFDIIQLEGLYLSPYIPLIKRHSNALISFRAHNIESEIWFRIYSNSRNLFKKAYLKILQRRLLKFERSIVNTYDVLVPISERDGKVFSQWGNKMPMHISPTGIIPDQFKKSEPRENYKNLFFIGSLDWIPNQEGITWLLEKVWPEIKMKLPMLELHIAGRNAPRWLVEKLNQSRIHYHGEVDDAAKFFDSNDLMLVPLFSGSGMRVKIVEAMARSKVVVTTPVGAEGLGLVNGMQARIEEYPKSYISAIFELCTQPRIFAEMSKNAFVYTEENFNNEKITALLLQFYKEHTA